MKTRHWLLAASALALAAASHAQGVMQGAEQSPAVNAAHLPSLRGAMAQTEGNGAENRVRPVLQILFRLRPAAKPGAAGVRLWLPAGATRCESSPQASGSRRS